MSTQYHVCEVDYDVYRTRAVFDEEEPAEAFAERLRNALEASTRYSKRSSLSSWHREAYYLTAGEWSSISQCSIDGKDGFIDTIRVYVFEAEEGIPKVRLRAPRRKS